MIGVIYGMLLQLNTQRSADCLRIAKTLEAELLKLEQANQPETSSLVGRMSYVHIENEVSSNIAVKQMTVHITHLAIQSPSASDPPSQRATDICNSGCPV